MATLAMGFVIMAELRSMRGQSQTLWLVLAVVAAALDTLERLTQ